MNTFYFGIVAITAFFALIVVIFVVYSAFKYRDDKVGAPIGGWMPLEIGWTLIPFFVSIGIFVWASIGFCRIVRGS